MRAWGERVHNVTRTPNPWMVLDAADHQQPLGATTQGHCIFSVDALTMSLGCISENFDPLSAIRFPDHSKALAPVIRRRCQP